ncbi:MAG: NifB/NifX family molybdenum-iron cluster-binding protein [Candidatus Hodarchaeota archaeon]
MRIAVSAIGKSLDSQLDQRFGRCAYFLIVDSRTMESEILVNAAAGARGGAGIQAAQSIVGKGVKVVITGNIGPNAFQTLSAAGIVVMIGASGTVGETIKRFTRGELHETKGPSVQGHQGMDQGKRRGQNSGEQKW